MQSHEFKEQFFSQLYDEYIDRVYRFVLFKVSNESMAQDITSETFTRLWKEISLDREVKNPSGFLFTIARNLVIDHYRGKDQNPVILDNLDIIQDTNQDIAKMAVQNDDMRIIVKALEQLKDEYRIAVSLYYIEQEPISDVAKALGKSQSTARVIIHRGMKQLKEILGK